METSLEEIFTNLTNLSEKEQEIKTDYESGLITSEEAINRLLDVIAEGENVLEEVDTMEEESKEELAEHNIVLQSIIEECESGTISEDECNDKIQQFYRDIEEMREITTNALSEMRETLNEFERINEAISEVGRTSRSRRR